MKERLRTDEKMYILELLLLFGICMFTMLQQAALVSVLFHATFVLLILAIVLQLCFRPVLNELHVLAFFTIVLAFIHVTVQADSLSFSYYKKLIMFACTVLMVPFVDAIPMKRRLASCVLVINLCISLLYVVMYWGLGIRGYLDIYVTLNFVNPNVAGMFLFHSILYCAIAFYYFRHWLLRIITAILFCLLFWLNNQTGTRSVFLALAFFCGLAVFNVVLKKDVKISPRFSFLLIVSPLVIALVYLALVKTNFLEQWFSGFVGRGKTLYSRTKIWEYALDWFSRTPVLGSYNGISNGTGVSQMHNTHLDVLVSYGTVPFILFIAILHQGTTKVLVKARSSLARICVFAFYAVLLQGSFEAALVSGGMGLYIMSFGFLLLAKYNADGTMAEVEPVLQSNV